MSAPVTGRTVLIAGASSPAGIATAGALDAAGARVIAVGSNLERLTRVAAEAPGSTSYACDLADPEQVDALAARLHRDIGPIDGLVHLVGGWRGGGGIPGQSDADWDVLHRNILTTLRNTSRSFYPDLLASDAGRLAIVSSTAVTHPTASGANYATAKAAAESWVMATADGFEQEQSRRQSDPEPQRAAAVRFVIKALVDESMRRSEPERVFSGYTDVKDLAAAVVELWTADAAQVNGSRIPLPPQG